MLYSPTYMLFKFHKNRINISLEISLLAQSQLGYSSSVAKLPRALLPCRTCVADGNGGGGGGKGVSSNRKKWQNDLCWLN